MLPKFRATDFSVPFGYQGEGASTEHIRILTLPHSQVHLSARIQPLLPALL